MASSFTLGSCNGYIVTLGGKRLYFAGDINARLR